MLLPLWSHEAQEDFRFIDGVLSHKVKTRDTAIGVNSLTMVRNAKARIWLSFRYDTKKEMMDGFPGG